MGVPEGGRGEPGGTRPAPQWPKGPEGESLRRHYRHPQPARQRWVTMAQNTVLIIAALVTAYLVYLAMMSTR